jgi:hypothetical protein
MTYDAIVARKGQLQAVTGLPEAAFAHLHTVFAAVVAHARRHYTLQGSVRQRALRVLPRDSAFAATEDLLLFVLSYLKSNPLQAAHAASFGLTQPQANAWLHRSLPWLREALARLGELPARPDQALPAVLARHPRVLLDATERPVPRSTDAETQRAHYSGKKKTHREK